MTTISKLVCIEISIFILLYGWFLARLIGAWSHPAVVYAVFWFGMTFLPLVVMFPLQGNIQAMIYILATVVAFSAPALCSNWHKSVMIAKSRLTNHEDPAVWLHLAFLFLQGIAVAFVFLNMERQGIPFAEFLRAPTQTSARYLALRYNNQIASNIFSQLGLTFSYIGAALGGMLVVSTSSRLRVLLIFALALAPPVLHMAIYADKGTLFLAGAFYFAGVLVTRVSRGNTALVDSSTLKIAILLTIIASPLIIYSLYIRASGNLAYYVSSYAFGHLYAFSDWFHLLPFEAGPTLEYTNPEAPTYGYWTFMAIAKYLVAAQELPPGYFAEYYIIPGVLSSNIFTMFRGLIYDFGIVGSLVFMSAFGFTASLAYRWMLATPAPVLAQVFYVLTIGCIYTSYIISLLVWSSIYASMVGLAVILGMDRAVKMSTLLSNSQAEYSTA
jgi:oligosaccharide repeat unit polymerase